MNIFSMFNTGKQGLWTAQYEMNVVDNNLTNAENKEYAKEVVSKSATFPYPGIKIDRLYRQVDVVLEKRINQVTQEKEYYNELKDGLKDIEAVLNELNEGGITTKLDEFWSAWQELANEAATPSYDVTAPSPVRVNLLQAAQDLANTIKDRYLSISNNQKTVQKDIEVSLAEINNLLLQIASYNKAIAKAETPEKEAAILKDKRQKALNDLAELIDITYVEQPDKSVTVYGPSGSLLVAGSEWWRLARSVSPEGIVSVYWMGGKEPLRIEPQKGKLAAQLQVNNIYVPKYLNYLDSLANTISSSVNSIHRNGFSVEGFTGINFFVGDGAGDIEVNPILVEDPMKIATSSRPFEEGNNEVALKIAMLKDEKVVGGTMSINEFVAQISTEIGIEVKQADTNNTIKDELLTSLKEKRSSISEVNKDEELAKLMLLEKQFQMASKIITVADNLLQTVINLVR